MKISEWVLISPEMASVWLENNTENRRLRKDWIEDLAGMIKRGEFRVTHQGIAFTKDGRLLDGQHRLMAIVMADMPVQMQVTYDADPDSFAVIDTGTRRTFDDAFKSDTTSSAVSFVIASMLNQHPSRDQQYAVFKLTDPVLHEMLTFWNGRKKGFTSSAIMAAAVARVMAGDDVDYIHAVYRDVARANTADLPPIAKAFCEQIYSGLASSRNRNNRLRTFARALKAFDKKSALIPKLIIQSPDPAVEFVRRLFAKTAESEKKPANTAPALARAKPPALSTIKRMSSSVMAGH